MQSPTRDALGRGLDGRRVPRAGRAPRRADWRGAAGRAGRWRPIALCGFDEGPSEMAVDSGAGRPEADLAAAGVEAGSMARGGGPLLSGGGPRDIPLLEGDHNREGEPPGGPGEQEAEWPASPGTRHGCAVRTRAARGRGPRWLKPLSGGLGRVRGLEREARPKEIAAGRAEEIAHVQVVEGVRGPGGVNPVLQLGVAGRAPSGCAASHADPAIRRGNPDGGQRAARLKSIESSRRDICRSHRKYRPARAHHARGRGASP